MKVNPCTEQILIDFVIDLFSNLETGKMHKMVKLAFLNVSRQKVEFGEK